MRYIGSKKPLLAEICSTIDRFNINKGGHVLDIFCGTGSVAQACKNRFAVTANDLLYFNFVTARGSLVPKRLPGFKKLIGVIESDPYDFLESSKEVLILAGTEPFVVESYSPAGTAGRRYFTEDNALRIDGIRLTLEIWKQERLINDDEYFVLLASLIRSVPSVASIAGTFGAYLKEWDRRALKPIRLERIMIEESRYEARASNMDANLLIRRSSGELLYLDPPYNGRQYSSNYHVLESIARYDQMPLKGVSGIRTGEEGKSKYCSKRQVGTVLSDLIANADFRYLVMSYSSEGILGKSDLMGILAERVHEGSLEFREIRHRRYQRISSSGDNQVMEYLVSGRLR